MTNEEIKNRIMLTNDHFKVKGHTKTFKGCDAKDGINRVIADVNYVFPDSMNIEIWGLATLCLYSYDMLNNKTMGHIAYDDVTFIDIDESVICDGCSNTFCECD